MRLTLTVGMMLLIAAPALAQVDAPTPARPPSGLMSTPAAVLAQNSSPSAIAGTSSPTVDFPSLTALPIPLQSTSGRFSSLDPPRQVHCQNSKVVGRVVSVRLIEIKQFACVGNDAGLPLENVLMNVQLANPADAVQMVVGRRVAIEGRFKIASEHHGSYLVFFLIAEKAELLAGDPIDRAAPVFTSYMICQPPELDALAKQLGSELCVQSSIMANLNAAGLALETAARALIQHSPTNAASSDPITCRRDPERSDAHLADMACARETYWAWWSIKQREGQDFTTPAPP